MNTGAAEIDVAELANHTDTKQQIVIQRHRLDSDS